MSVLTLAKKRSVANLVNSSVLRGQNILEAGESSSCKVLNMFHLFKKLQNVSCFTFGPVLIMSQAAAEYSMRVVTSICTHSANFRILQVSSPARFLDQSSNRPSNMEHSLLLAFQLFQTKRQYLLLHLCTRHQACTTKDFLGQRSPRRMKVFTKIQGHRSRNGQEMFESAYDYSIYSKHTCFCCVVLMLHAGGKNQVCHPLGAFDIDVSP